MASTRVRPAGLQNVFAFGALLHPSKVNFGRDISCVQGFTPTHTMEFSHQGGFATLSASERSAQVSPFASPGSAQGVVYELRPDEVEVLKKRERGYELQSVAVHAASSGEVLLAFAFISSRWQRLSKPVPPTCRYADLVLSGAELRGLPEAHIAWLQAVRAECVAAREPLSSTLPARYFNTPSRRLSTLGLAATSVALVGWPVGSRMWQCRDGWEAGTSCSTFLPAAADESTAHGRPHV